MKRWILDVLVGVGSLVIFIILLLVLPTLIAGDIAYLIALFGFITVISIGGFFIKDFN